MKILVNWMVGLCLLAGILFWVFPQNLLKRQDPVEEVGMKFGNTTSHAGRDLVISFPETANEESKSLVFEKTASTSVSREQTLALLNKLPPFEQEPQTEAFHKRLKTRPAPRPGETLKQPFPNAETSVGTPTQVENNGPLKVLRFAPEGSVEAAAAISITFSKPMVPLSSHEDLGELPLPLTMEPKVAGNWRWVGSQTLIFDRKERLPMATKYSLSVSSTAKALDGSRLEAPLSWTFDTPPIKVNVSLPHQSQPLGLKPVFRLIFDQELDPQAMEEFVILKQNGVSIKFETLNANQLVAYALEEMRQQNRAPQTRVTDDNSFSPESALNYFGLSPYPGKWLALTPTTAFEPNQAVTLTVAAGAPSTEGPLISNQEQSFSFKTYQPLELQRTSWERRQPLPNQPLSMTFNNPLNQSLFKPEWVELNPEVPRLTVENYGRNISLRGHFQAKTDYTITIKPDLQDRFGQKLNKALKLKFSTGHYNSALLWGLPLLHVSDPYLDGGLEWLNVNVPKVTVTVRKVMPTDWQKMVEANADPYNRRNVKLVLPGDVIHQKELKLDAKQILAPQIQKLALKEHLQNDLGQVIVSVEPDRSLLQKIKGSRPIQSLSSWIQVTNIGLTAFVDSAQIQVWVNTLKTGEPLAGTKLELRKIADGSVVAATTADENGLGKFDLTSPQRGGPLMVVAIHGEDVAFLPENTSRYPSGSRWYFSAPSNNVASFLTDGRGLFKPGQRVEIKGWVRSLNAMRANQPKFQKAEELKFTVQDSRGNKFAEGRVALSEIGSVDFGFDIPDNVNLGYAHVSLTPVNMNREKNDNLYTVQHSFQIQEFRRPEYEVNASVSPGPHVIGDTVFAQVNAAYYAGGGLANAPVRWEIRANRTNYAPPGWPEYTFGAWVPWWQAHPGQTMQSSYQQNGTTNSDGRHDLLMKLESVGSQLPYTCTLNSAVRDVNAQEWQANTSFLVHPGSLYVGLKTRRYFVAKGQPFAVEVMVTDIDGQAVPGQKIQIEVIRTKWTWQGSETKDVFKTELLSESKPASFKFPTSEGGTYTVRARVSDAKGRANLTEMNRWVTGGVSRGSQGQDLENLTLIPNKERYQPGDVAEILVQSPFPQAEGMAIVRQYNMRKVIPLQFQDGSATVVIPITEDHIPNVGVQVELTGFKERLDASGVPDESLPKAVAQATGFLNLKVPAKQRGLEITVTPEKSGVQPGSSPEVLVQVKDANGKAVAGADVALIMVDEALLALSGFQLGDPLSVFYPEVNGAMAIARLRELLQIRSYGSQYPTESIMEEGMVADALMAPMASPTPRRMQKFSRANETFEMVASEEASPVKIRTNFNPVAAFLPNLKTDSAGIIKTQIKLPDNLTRYRIMVLAANDAMLFGTGESSLTARLPLMIRPSAPRFLNYGDRFEIPFVVQNQTEEALSVTLVARAQNLALQETAGQRFDVAAGDRVEILIPAAAESAGTARLQAAVFADVGQDAAEISLPVWTPATTEAFATYGVIDEGAISQKIAAPQDVFEEFGGLDISTSSTALQGLTDAFVYLLDYPFECSEQITSRMLAIAALRDVLNAFDGNIEPERLEKAVEQGVARLATLQNADGGFGFWYRNETSWPFLTIHVAHGLVRVKAKGYAIPEQTLQRALRYLKQIERHYDDRYSKRMRYSLSSYAVYVLRLAGESTAGRAGEVFAKLPIDQAPIEGLGWLLPSLSNAQQRETLHFLNNRISETAATAQITSRYEDKGYLVLHAKRRDDAVLLESLIEVDSSNDIIVKLVRGLMASQVKGRWSSTQENVFVLLALDKYFQTFESKRPQFLAEIWLNNQFAGDQTFSGRETVRRELNVPMDWVQSQGQTELIVSKQGEGRLYYRLGMTYAPQDLTLEPANHGFFVSRSYEGLDDAEDVQVDENGKVTVKRGARVKVTVSMVAPAQRYHVALVDPLPAGFEPLNPSLKGNQPPPQTGRRPWVWSWFGHQNLRDERAEAFSTYVYPGGYEYSYVARATTPGTYVVPPAKAEEMYFPETFGRSGTTWVEVK